MADEKALARQAEILNELKTQGGSATFATLEQSLTRSDKFHIKADLSILQLTGRVVKRPGGKYSVTPVDPKAASEQPTYAHPASSRWPIWDNRPVSELVVALSNRMMSYLKEGGARTVEEVSEKFEEQPYRDAIKHLEKLGKVFSGRHRVGKPHVTVIGVSRESIDSRVSSLQDEHTLQKQREAELRAAKKRDLARQKKAAKQKMAALKAESKQRAAELRAAEKREEANRKRAEKQRAAELKAEGRRRVAELREIARREPSQQSLIYFLDTPHTLSQVRQYIGRPNPYPQETLESLIQKGSVFKLKIASPSAPGGEFYYANSESALRDLKAQMTKEYELENALRYLDLAEDPVTAETAAELASVPIDKIKRSFGYACKLGLLHQTRKGDGECQYCTTKPSLEIEAVEEEAPEEIQSMMTELLGP